LQGKYLNGGRHIIFKTKIRLLDSLSVCRTRPKIIKKDLDTKVSKSHPNICSHISKKIDQDSMKKYEEYISWANGEQTVAKTKSLTIKSKCGVNSSPFGN
jgi:hypothetical protein